MRATLRGLPPRGKLGLGIVAAAVAAVLCFAIGVAVGRPDYPRGDSPEVGFLRDMSAHHAQAVEMGLIAYRDASRADVRSLAIDIATTQKGQIGRMQGWLALWGVNVNSTDPPMSWVPDGVEALRGNLMPGMATREELDQLEAATGEQVDILFLQYMSRHHLGGIHMVDDLFLFNPSEPVRGLAETMKAGQQGEIDLMAEMLADLGASPLPA